jgi:hypothetical protein
VQKSAESYLRMGGKMYRLSKTFFGVSLPLAPFVVPSVQAQQPLLQMTYPFNGSLFQEGQTYTITLSVDPSVQDVNVFAQDPSGISLKDNSAGSIYFFFRRHTIVSGSRPLPGVMSPRRSIALMVLRLADRGRISSLSFNRRRTGLPPSESVSSWYPSWRCESSSCSASVSFGRRLASGFLFRHSSRPFAGGSILPLAQSYYWGLGAATDAVPPPKPKPRATGLLLIMPPIRSREVARAQRPGVRRGEDAL